MVGIAFDPHQSRGTPAPARLDGFGGRFPGSRAARNRGREAGREAASRGRGVIRDEQERHTAIARARDAIEVAGFRVVSEVDSAITGPKGNVERFVWAQRMPPH